MRAAATAEPPPPADRRRGALRSRARRASAGRRRRRPRARATAWNARTALPRLAPEHAVGADAERALDRDRGRRGQPLVDRAAATAPAAERAARDRADDAVDLEPVRGLERAHRAPRLAPEHAVGGDPQHALDLGHRRAARCRCAGARRRTCRPPRSPGPARPRWPARARSRRHQRRRDERLLLAVGGRAARGGRLAAPDRAGQRALPQVGAAEVAATRWLRTDRPAVVEQVHASMEPGRPDGLMNRLGPSTTAAVSSRHAVGHALEVADQPAGVGDVVRREHPLDLGAPDPRRRPPAHPPARR